jgi:hypothetical protein
VLSPFAPDHPVADPRESILSEQSRRASRRLSLHRRLRLRPLAWLAAVAVLAGALVASPVTAEAATSGQGASPLGSLSYPIASGAVYVAVDSGKDTNAGTIAAPLKTVAAAIAKAPNGGQIVLRAGTYHEAVVIPTAKRLTIQSYPKEVVWFDGASKVSAFTASGSTWKLANWSFAPTNVMDGKADNPGFVDPAHPMAARPDQVFYDGVAMKQVGSAAQVTAGTFFADRTAKTLTIGSNPSGHKVYASDLQQAIYVMSPGSVLQGFGVRHYATPYGDRSAIRLANTGITARELTIEDNAMIGVNVENNSVTLDHLTVVRSGLMGITHAYGLWSAATCWLNIWYLGRIVGIGVRAVLNELANIALATLAMGVAVSGLEQVLSDRLPLLGAALACAALGAAIYLPICWMLKEPALLTFWAKIGIARRLRTA